MEYKRFMVFEITEYYPTGGLGDCISSFDTLEEADQFYNNSLDVHSDEAYIFDRIEGDIVKSTYE